MKKVKLICVMLIILIFFSIPFVYADDSKDSFITAKSDELAVNEEIELILNLEDIEYNDFSITITSDLDMKEMEESEDIDIEKSSDKIKMNFIKESNNINTIVLSYKIPETYKTGDIITFNATLKDNENEENEEYIEKIEIKIIDKEENINDSEKVDKEEDIEDVEENNKEEKEDIGDITPNTENQEKSNTGLQENLNNVAKVSNNLEKDSSKELQTEIGSNIQVTLRSSSNNYENNNVETVVYNGSSNNYLANLYVEGYDFTESFKKENETYFLTIDNNVDNLSLIAEPEDNESVVKIYGIENIDTGTNKILITVTAKDGSVRNYRIYVIRQEGE